MLTILLVQIYSSRFYKPNFSRLFCKIFCQSDSISYIYARKSNDSNYTTENINTKMRTPKIAIASAATLAVTANVFALNQRANQQERPNVLFIIVDDLGWNDISCMGSTYYETPNIDRIARQGVRFTDAYATCQVSSPSRSSIMTGKYTTRTGVTDWIGEKSGEAWRSLGRHSKLLPADYAHEMKLEEFTIAEALQAEGYRTFFAGKWHLGETSEYWPEHQGFEINKGGWASGGPKGGYFAPYDNPRLESGPDGENLSLRLANETIDFIAERAEDKAPFFAYLSFYAVHGAIQCTKPKWDYFRRKAIRQGVAPIGFAVDRTMPVRLNQDNPVYAGLISQMDDAIGMVLHTLRQLNLDENTLIVFTSDNGGVVAGDSNSSCLYPLRGGKGRQWEGGIRVPVLLSGPGIQQGVCSAPVSGIDFYPTILDYLGMSMPSQQQVDGRSMKSLLENPQDIDSWMERALYWHYPHYGNQGGEPSSIVRLGDWKLIHYYEDGRDELYNLRRDIGEHAPVNTMFPEKVKELRSLLDNWLKETNARIPVVDPLYNAKAEKIYLVKKQERLLKMLEKQRASMLKPTWTPNKDWWGTILVE